LANNYAAVNKRIGDALHATFGVPGTRSPFDKIDAMPREEKQRVFDRLLKMYGESIKIMADLRAKGEIR